MAARSCCRCRCCCCCFRERERFKVERKKSHDDRCDCPSKRCSVVLGSPCSLAFLSLSSSQKRQPRTLASSGRYRTSEVEGGESETCRRRASAAASERSPATGAFAIFFLFFFFGKVKRNRVDDNRERKRELECFQSLSPPLLVLTPSRRFLSLSSLLHMALGSLTKSVEVQKKVDSLR